MSLITCPECERRISDKAEMCPNCGLPSRYFFINYKNTSYEANIDISNISSKLISFEQDFSRLFGEDNYISSKQINDFVEKYNFYYENIFSNSNIFQDVKENHIKYSIDLELLKNFQAEYEDIQDKVYIHNENFVERKLIEDKEYFDNLLKKIDPNIFLDEEQRQAVVTDDDYCLLVAGAGAGKTTTMAAKVKYLVEKRDVNPEEILVISYTNKAIEELKERINKTLGIPAKISTFHSFGYEIIKTFKDTRPEINYNSYNIIFNMFEETIYRDKQFMKNFIRFMGYYFDIPEQAFDFKSLEEYHQYKAAMDYETLKSNLESYIKIVQDSRTRQQKTLEGEFLRSMQEVQIANFLYLNGIEYEYEKEYPYPIPNARKKYTPDFYIYQGENEAYIEHYGISQDYKNSSFSDIQIEQYKNNVKDKQKMHSLRKTKLITTWSKYNDGKTLLEHLEEGLQKNGFIFKSRDPKEVYDKIIKTGKDKYVIKFILFMREFIERYKTLGYDLNGFNILRKKTTNQRNLLFLDLAEKVYNHYQDTLRAQNKIDFADMLNEGKLYLDEIERQGGKLNYKYIIIDEFQDVARQRFNFTKRLSDIANAKVVAVGDDWQSIYAFAGSDITLFTRFIELMGGDGKELKITHTYRNSQELIDIAGNFVQKNTSQIRKRLISPKHLEQPIVVDAFEDTYPIFTNLAICIEDMIGEIIDEFGSKSKILLIGRYNFDLYKILNTKKFNVTGNEKLKSQKYPQADLTFMTAHKSKGLGYDNVILINMFEGKFGFPSQIEEDPIMKLVTHEDTAIPFAEERRLLYVALTRTKNRVYIAAPMNRPSRFLIELINDYRLEHPEEMNMKVRNLFQLRCPKCGFPLKNEYNKNYGLQLFICTNEPEVCSFMTNSKECMRDIHLCPECGDGYMIVNKNKNDSTFFFGCTNYDTDKKCQCKERIDK